MKNYKVYFSIYGKKLQVKVMAHDEKHAEAIVKQKIDVLKVEKCANDTFNECVDILDKINGIFTEIIDKKGK